MEVFLDLESQWNTAGAVGWLLLRSWISAVARMLLSDLERPPARDAIVDHHRGPGRGRHKNRSGAAIATRGW
jgi:hypothetical protein